MLVDALCSGSGTWQRNPLARLRLTPSDLDELCTCQAAILEEASRLVRKNGRVVYATCPILAEENEAQVNAFLFRHPEFRLLPLTRAWPGLPPAQGNFPVLTLRRHGTDGFFAAVLEKVG